MPLDLCWHSTLNGLSLSLSLFLLARERHHRPQHTTGELHLSSSSFSAT